MKDVMSAIPEAVLLIAHGSRRKEANDDLVRLAEMLQGKLTGHDVRIAYLELAEPSIPDALEQCLADGLHRIRMLPWFLSAGSHVTDDLTAFRDDFAHHYPQASVTLHPPLGLHPLMLDILSDRLSEQL